MKKYLSVLLGALVIIAVFYLARGLSKGICRFGAGQKIKYIEKTVRVRSQAMDTALELLRVRKDSDALVIFNQVLVSQPDNLDALWGKAEVLRRSRNYKESARILNEILKKDPKHAPALISLSYIAYKDDKLTQAEELINRVFVSDRADTDSQALAYMMLGAINSRRSAQSGLFNKIKYGTQIKCHFLKARALARDLPEVYLGLGSFYLLAPLIFGRNIDQAIEELEVAVKIAPDFATACARLAQCYKKKDMQDKYAFYMSRAKRLDPQNEVLQELGK